MKGWLKNGLGMAEGPAAVVTARAHSFATGFTATRDAWLAGLITGDGAGEVVTRTLAATSDLDPHDPADADVICQAEASFSARPTAARSPRSVGPQSVSTRSLTRRSVPGSVETRSTTSSCA
jgi:hypothetical protein